MAEAHAISGTIQRGKPRPLLRDAVGIFSFFGKGPAGIKSLKALAESMDVRAWTNTEKAIGRERAKNEKAGWPEESEGKDAKCRLYCAYARWSFGIESAAYNKLGKILAENGEYLAASEAYGKAGRTHGRAITSGYGDGMTRMAKDGTILVDFVKGGFFGMGCYYTAKHEATAPLEKSIWAGLAPPSATQK